MNHKCSADTPSYQHAHQRWPVQWISKSEVIMTSNDDKHKYKTQKYFLILLPCLSLSHMVVNWIVLSQIWSWVSWVELGERNNSKRYISPWSIPIMSMYMPVCLFMGMGKKQRTSSLKVPNIFPGSLEKMQKTQQIKTKQKKPSISCAEKSHFYRLYALTASSDWAKLHHVFNIYQSPVI